MTDRLRTSAEVHEAAHAVVGWAQGQRIRVVVVRPKAEGLAGFVQFEPLAGVSPLEADIIDLTTTEAGRLAQDMVFPQPVRPTDEAGYVALTERWTQVLPDQEVREHVQYALSDANDGESFDDEAAIAAIVAKHANDEAIWLMALCRARAVRLINEHRDAILALVAELSRRPILGGPPAEAIIEAAHERS
jgi:ATP-dependent Zn protease